MKTKLKTAIGEKVQRLFNIELKSIDEQTRTVDFVFSDDSVDRYEERVDQKTWRTDNYEKNPVFLWGHNPSELENVLGKGVKLELDQPSGKKGIRQSILSTQFADAETNPKADLAFRMVKAGIIRTVSAGFIPHSFEIVDDIVVLKDNELLEVSLVAIPANPNAIALAFKAGELREKDAGFLLKSMREGAEAIEAELKANEETPELKEELAAITKSLSELSETVTKSLTDLSETVATLAADVTELKTAKPDGEATPPAKGGDDDQPGAGEEPDLDDELSDEDLDALEVEEETNDDTEGGDK